ncbi:TerD family protein [Rhodococcus sp. NPDC049939]|uniref:TerD family protein n=1 Tax=Rhodococcus sp. NPDC049939 TaxID=3155511 RepID=UPI0033C6E795
MKLVKGQNTGLDAHELTVTCAWRRTADLDADLSALLLVDGKVCGDDDFVFYNQALSPDEAVRHDGKQESAGRVIDRISCNLHRVDPRIDTVALAVSLDSPNGRLLRELGDIDVAVHDTDDTVLAMFSVTSLTSETAVVTLELYRRDDRWKVRAIGQGYSDGLAGLARDFGVAVEAGAPEPVPVPAGPPPIDWTNPPVPAGYEL